MTRVVNLRREAYDVYIGRAGHGLDGFFGNPFPVMGARGTTLGFFRDYFAKRVFEDMEFLVRVLELRGLRLGCFCKPLACHGDTYVEFVENFPKEWADALIASWRRDHPKVAA